MLAGPYDIICSESLSIFSINNNYTPDVVTKLLLAVISLISEVLITVSFLQVSVNFLLIINYTPESEHNLPDFPINTSSSNTVTSRIQSEQTKLPLHKSSCRSAPQPLRGADHISHDATTTQIHRQVRARSYTMDTLTHPHWFAFLSFPSRGDFS